MISVTVNPNFERNPPDDCHRPLPRAASFTRMPIWGALRRWAVSDEPSSVFRRPE
jgi:hypothetical protein